MANKCQMYDNLFSLRQIMSRPPLQSPCQWPAEFICFYDLCGPVQVKKITGLWRFQLVEISKDTYTVNLLVLTRLHKKHNSGFEN